MTVGIGEKDVALSIYCNAIGARYADRFVSILKTILAPISGDSLDGPRYEIDRPNPTVEGVGNIEDTVPTQG